MGRMLYYQPFPQKVLAKVSQRRDLRLKRRLYKGVWAKTHLTDRLFFQKHQQKYENVELGARGGKWYLVYGRKDKMHTGGFKNKHLAIQWYVRDGR